MFRTFHKDKEMEMNMTIEICMSTIKLFIVLDNILYCAMLTAWSMYIVYLVL